MAKISIISGIFTYCRFLSLLIPKKRKKASERKRKEADVFYALTGIDLALQCLTGKPVLFRSLSMLTHHVRGVRIVST